VTRATRTRAEFQALLIRLLLGKFVSALLPLLLHDDRAAYRVAMHRAILLVDPGVITVTSYV